MRSLGRILVISHELLPTDGIHRVQHPSLMLSDPLLPLEGVLKLPSGKAQCLACGKVFFDMGTGKRHHRRVHALPQALKCHLCPSEFVTSDNFKAHLRQRHKIYQLQMPKEERF